MASRGLGSGRQRQPPDVTPRSVKEDNIPVVLCLILCGHGRGSWLDPAVQEDLIRSRRYSDGDPSSGVAEKKCYRRKRRREDARPLPRDAAPNSRSAYQRFAFTSYGGERGVLHSWLGGGNSMEHQW